MRRAVERYTSLLRVPSVPTLLASAFVTGLGTGALTLTLVLLVAAETGSFERAGLVSGSYLVATGVCGPMRGRLIDRFGPSTVLVRTAALHGTALVALLVLVERGAPSGSLAVAAAVAGAAAPTVGPALRLLWPELLGEERDVGYAVQTVISEAFLLIGPLVAAALAGFGDARLALAVIILSDVAGTIVFAAVPPVRAWRGVAPKRRSAAGALVSSGVRALVVVAFLLGAAVGVIELAVPAFAADHGDAAFGGVGLAALAAASLVGGLVYGSRRWPGSVRARYVALVSLLAITMIPLPFAASPWALVAALALSGLGWAPVSATAFALFDGVAVPGTAAEAIAWNGAAFMIGMAAGTALGGRLIEHVGPSSTLWAAPACATIGLAALLACRSALGAHEGQDPAA